MKRAGGGNCCDMVHRCVALSGLLAAAVAAAPTAALAQSPPAITGDGFTTTLPAGWTSHDYASVGGRAWAFASPGTTTNKLATPSPGGIGVTAWVSKASAAEHRLGSLPSSPVKLVAKLTGVPKGAKHVKLSSKPHASKLAGVKAGSITLTYTLDGRSIVQRDVAVRHGSRLYEIELDVDAANAAAGQGALRAILGAWKFSG
jgi:hypothetical protein